MNPCSIPGQGIFQFVGFTIIQQFDNPIQYSILLPFFKIDNVESTGIAHTDMDY